MRRGMTRLALSALAAALLLNGQLAWSADAPPEVSAEKRSYKRSRLTSDESELEADRRKLLLSTGEDRAVDLTLMWRAPTA